MAINNIENHDIITFLNRVNKVADTYIWELENKKSVITLIATLLIITGLELELVYGIEYTIISILGLVIASYILVLNKKIKDINKIKYITNRLKKNIYIYNHIFYINDSNSIEELINKTRTRYSACLGKRKSLFINLFKFKNDKDMLGYIKDAI